MSQWISPQDTIRTQYGQQLARRRTSLAQKGTLPPMPAVLTGQALYPSNPPVTVQTPNVATANRPPRQYIVPTNPNPPPVQTRAAWPEASASTGIGMIEMPLYAGQLDGKVPEEATQTDETAKNAPSQDSAQVIAPVLSPETHAAVAETLPSEQGEHAAQEGQAPAAQNQVLAIYGVDPSETQGSPIAHASCDTVRSVERRLLALEERLLNLENKTVQPAEAKCDEPTGEGYGDTGDDGGFSMAEYYVSMYNCEHEE